MPGPAPEPDLRDLIEPGSERHHDPEPVEISHQLRLELTARSDGPVQLVDLISATSRALIAGVPPTATVDVDTSPRRGSGPRWISYGWATEPEPLVSRLGLAGMRLRDTARALAAVMRRG